MKNIVEIKLKSFNFKLKAQTKQLQVVQGIISRSSGYTKTQAEASEKRLTLEIADLNKNIKTLQGKK